MCIPYLLQASLSMCQALKNPAALYLQGVTFIITMTS